MCYNSQNILGFLLSLIFRNLGKIAKFHKRYIFQVMCKNHMKEKMIVQVIQVAFLEFNVLKKFLKNQIVRFMCCSVA